ncbi:PX-domain-containing protein [Trametes cingulata]|nr:PX-domain-containing protein [Trametes cingulata]
MSDTASSPPKAALLQIPQVLSRPHSDLEFDSGINTSAAWTVSLASPEGGARLSLNSLNNGITNGLRDKVPEEETEPEPEPEPDTAESIAEDDSLNDEEGRPARALYSFQGKAEFRELTHVEAGDELEVMREDVGEGWSLARLARTSLDRESGQGSEMGLIPRSYYIFTAEFAQTEGLLVPSTHSRMRSRREASNDSITPRGSPTRATEALPIVPQNTGEWFPSFRRSLLGGKSLNRFSSFVTSGAEEFVLQGSSEDASQEAPRSVQHVRSGTEDSKRESVLGSIVEADQHFVEAGPSWKTKVPPFRVLVHSPSKRASTLSGAYTMYTVTTAFDALSHSRITSDSEYDDDGDPPSPVRITVHRRFSHFVALHTALTRLLPGIALPPLPEKQYAGRFSDDFVEARRGDLERYINRVVRHPVARYAEVLTFFLGCESDAEWRKQLPYYLSMPPKGPSFYANVYHPAFNVDAEEASEATDRFVNHTRAVGKGVQGLRNIFGKVREARVEMSKAERLLSYSLLSLITAKPLASAPTTGISEEDEEQASTSHGHVNEDGAWCWRENCESCLKLTKAMQKTSETLQIVADLYDDHARRTQLATHEAFKNVAHPSTLYAPVVDTHKSTLSRYHDAVRDGCEDEEMAARCETVLNITMAEMDTYHTQKVEDFQELAKEHLDGEIAFYEQILTRLRTARKAFDPPQYDELARSPRQPSIYERELEHPRLTSQPLSQPCPHVFDSAPMRPVSVAIQEGVGMLLGGVASPARGSVFGKFW